jgi:hypothetical protein
MLRYTHSESFVDQLYGIELDVSNSANQRSRSRSEPLSSPLGSPRDSVHDNPRISHGTPSKFVLKEHSQILRSQSRSELRHKDRSRFRVDLVQKLNSGILGRRGREITSIRRRGRGRQVASGNKLSRRGSTHTGHASCVSIVFTLRPSIKRSLLLWLGSISLRTRQDYPYVRNSHEETFLAPEFRPLDTLS